MDDLEFLKTHAPSTVAPGPAATARSRQALRARMEAAEALESPQAAKRSPADASQAARRPAARHRLVRWAGLAAACAVAAIVAGAFLLSGGPARPDTAAAAALHKAAATARKQPVPAPLASGQYAYTKSKGVFMTSTAAEGQPKTSTHTPFVREVWMGEQSRLRETSGKAEFVTAADRQAWIAAGSPDFFGHPGTSVDSLGSYTPLDLPTDPDVLFTQLKAKAAGHGTGLYNEMFVLVGDALRETATSPAQRAALYDVAARIPGVELVGDVTDSAGRPGVAVAMTNTSSHIRQLLVFDPKTSQLLAEEQRVTDGNEFGWPAGTLVGETTYLVHAVVGSNSEVPAAARD